MAACRNDWRHGRAFGLDLAGRFRAPGIFTGAGRAASSATTLELAPRLALGREWPQGGRERLHAHQFGDGGPMLTVDRSAQGYLLRVEGWGVYRVSPTGEHVLLAPGRALDWRGLRLVTAQVLPLAALARGYELLHASAVGLGDRTIAIAGDSDSGKTTIAAHLALGGASMVTDDVLAVEGRDEGLVAHPGPRLLNLPGDIAADLTRDERRRLGAIIGRDAGGWRMLVEREERALPLAALYFREPCDGPSPRVEPVGRPDPALLLRACFHRGLRIPGRLATQL